MKIYWCFALVVCGSLNTQAQSRQTQVLPEAEYYVAAYAQHYKLPIGFVRAVVAQESGWRACAISSKGGAGLMQE